MPGVTGDTPVREIEREIGEILESLPREQHSDLFRATVFLGQLDIAKFIYHDKRNNPYTRYRKTLTKRAEKIAFSQALVQLLLLMKVRGLDFAKVFDYAVAHMKDRDWMERKPANDREVRGSPVTGGKVSGRAYVVDDGNPHDLAPEGSIVVIEHAGPEVAELLARARAVVTDQGGRLCHMAVVARENGIPAVIGTGNATSLIRTGDMIHVDADEGSVRKGG